MAACDTLIAQAFGARDYEATEYWTRMGFLVMTLLSIPAMVLFQFGEWFVREGACLRTSVPISLEAWLRAHCLYMCVSWAFEVSHSTAVCGYLTCAQLPYNSFPPVFRQDEKLSRMAGRYTQLLLPGLWFMCMFIVMQVHTTIYASIWVGWGLLHKTSLTRSTPSPHRPNTNRNRCRRATSSCPRSGSCWYVRHPIDRTSNPRAFVHGPLPMHIAG